MSVKTSYLYDNEDITTSSNQVLDLFISTMKKEGVINDKQMNEMASYKVVLHKKGFFGKMFNKLFSKEGTTETSFYTVVKIIPMEDNKK